ncbi:OPT oligopeptide transporter protein-domain-containing protein [Myxozyma melibiosi]|uniref:OPT oligopeptide transporter protein-domain-containing protein n=1 Tax=Myxozyma melibiosi TaxID=54550 RepID=A0ABR1F3J6_9ASCO
MAHTHEIEEDSIALDSKVAEKIPEYKSDQLAFTSSVEEGSTDEYDLKARNIAGFDPNAPTGDDPIDTKDDKYAVETELEDSPYPEVRAAVPNVDDSSMPVNTIRMWVLGLILSTVGSSLNMFFSMHSPAFTLTPFVVSIIAWPLGRAWDLIMPDISIFGLKLKDGRFNVKEHAMITVMSNVSFGGGAAYSTDIFLSMTQYYDIHFGWGFMIVTTIATQCIGFSVGGLFRRILVYPGSMIWPSNLVTATFLTNIHKNDNFPVSGWKISRLRLFNIIFGCGFLYYWFPGYLAQFLSYFGWITWIRPNNVVLNQVFGVATGMGLMPITFDWNQIAGYIGSPLVPPFFATANIALSMLIIFWIIVPAVHFTNTWYGKYLPMSDSSTYDRYQSSYNVSRILNADLTFNEDAYKDYSPLFMSTTFAMSYGLSFASITATVMHTALFHGKEIMFYWKKSRNAKPDIHMKLMSKYKETPDWWFGVVFLVVLALSIVSVRVWDTDLPVWALILALILAFVMTAPIGTIQAITNLQVGLNVLTEFIVGYMLPGRPIAMMLFKTFGYITMSQALYFVSDMKLGHYMKVPPRTMFWGQCICTIWTSIVQVATMQWALGSITDVCSSTQPSHFTCPNAKVFFNASVIWGVIGPQRIFSHGMIYYGLLFFFVAGFVLPIITWLIVKWKPKSIAKYINWPVFFTGTGLIPPATPYNYASFCLVGFFFNYYLKRKYFAWWAKYNYTISAGLDIGLAAGSLLVFLTTALTNTDAPSWWGNNVLNTVDYNGEAIQVLVSEEQPFFGPTSW